MSFLCLKKFIKYVYMKNYLVLAINYNKHQYKLLETQLTALNLHGRRCQIVVENANKQNLIQDVEQILKDSKAQFTLYRTLGEAGMKSFSSVDKQSGLVNSVTEEKSQLKELHGTVEGVDINTLSFVKSETLPKTEGTESFNQFNLVNSITKEKSQNQIVENLVIILTDKYICLNKNLINILNNNIDNECSNYKLGNNWLFIPGPHNGEIKELNICKEITRQNYNEIIKTSTDNMTCIYYNTGKNPRDIVLFERYVDHLYPIIPKKYTDDFKFSNNLEINIFLDKKSGFQDELFLYILKIDFGSGSDGENIELNVYNGFTNYLWIKDWLEDKIQHSKISKCKFNFINFEKLDENVSKQTKEYRLISYKKFHNSNNDYYFVIDNTHMLDNSNVFKALYLQNRDIMVPLLYQDGKLFSNFWTDYDEKGFYLNSDIYYKILSLKIKHILSIPYFCGTALIKKSIYEEFDLNKSYSNNKWLDSDHDITLCNNLRNNNIGMYLHSGERFGRIIQTSEASKYWDKKQKLDLYLTKDSKIDWERKYSS
uniref:Uncharacterized protein n=1 Tax=Mimivirus LCMiAC02 TaxID=2506609 RepID=A0A481Z0V4_9VIRU|nr:MAG: uncharacterized protein LCMiAC02_02370 [Mimivirus LCMiAC02]